MMMEDEDDDDINADYFKPITGVIPPAGGSIKSPYCDVIVPPNAVENDTAITMTAMKDESKEMKLDGPLFPVTKVIKFEPSGLKFNKPVTVKLHTSYVETDRPVKVQIVSEQAALNGEEGKQPIKSGIELGDEHRITFQLDHLTKVRGWIDRRFYPFTERRMYYRGLLKYYREKLPVFNWVFKDVRNDKEDSYAFIGCILVRAGEKLALQVKSKNPIFSSEPDTHFIKNLHADFEAERCFAIKQQTAPSSPVDLRKVLVSLLEREEFCFTIKKPTGTYDESNTFFFPPIPNEVLNLLDRPGQ